MDDTNHEALYGDTMRAFLRLHRYLRRYSRRIRAEGISGRKMSALRLLAENGSQTIGQLGEYLAISDSTASEMMTQLGSMGYVTRNRSATDQRVVYVELTEEGKEFAQNASLGGIPLLRERLRSLPPDRLLAIRDTYCLLLELLEIDHDCT